MSYETVTFLAFVLSHGARKPCSVDIVDLGMMALQITIRNSASALLAAIEFESSWTQSCRKKTNVDVVLLGKMLF